MRLFDLLLQMFSRCRARPPQFTGKLCVFTSAKSFYANDMLTCGVSLNDSPPAPLCAFCAYMKWTGSLSGTIRGSSEPSTAEIRLKVGHLATKW